MARFATEFQTLDRCLQSEGRSLDVFMQVNTSGEVSKYGLTPESVPAFIQAFARLQCVSYAWIDDAGAFYQ
ncbi:MAG: hypothetical protein ACSLEN_05845 [Candidatus Malihini olakiniferum]